MRSFRIIGLLLGIIILAGCTRVKSTVTYFYEPPALDPGTSVIVRPLDSQKSDLEFSHYKKLVSNSLEEAGFNVRSTGKAEYDVFLQYAVDQQGNTEEYVVPQTHTYTNPYGVSTTYTTYSTGTRQVHQREVELRFFKSGNLDGTNEPVVHVRLLSSGSNNEMAYLMPTFVYQLLKEWPGTPGKTYTITSAVKK